MKKTCFSLILLAFAIVSCNKKVNIYSDKSSTTVVYMILDSAADTTFAKITKTFVGDATILAQDYNACNYTYDEIKVWLVRTKTNDSIRMDTVSKWIPKDSNSTFYSGCRQTYYYTTTKLISGQEYKLVVKRNDGVVVTSSVKTINKLNFIFPETDKSISLTKGLDSIKWKVTDYATNNLSNAAMLEVTAIFHYKEIMPGATDTVSREISLNMASGTPESMYLNKRHLYKVNYVPNKFFDLLEKDEYLVNNSPAGVKRFVENFEFRISEMGQNLYEYVVANNAHISFQDPPAYSNIENGVGLVSAKFQQSQFNKLNQITRKRITEDFSYGFVYDPNW